MFVTWSNSSLSPLIASSTATTLRSCVVSVASISTWTVVGPAASSSVTDALPRRPASLRCCAPSLTTDSVAPVRETSICTSVSAVTNSPAAVTTAFGPITAEALARADRLRSASAASGRADHWTPVRAASITSPVVRTVPSTTMEVARSATRPSAGEPDSTDSATR